VTDSTCHHFCINGYHDNNGEQGQIYSCDEAQLSGIPIQCSAATCADITVYNSSAYNIGGVTLDQATVVCDWGFYSRQGISFNISCVGSGPGASDWSNVQRCLPAFEIKLVFTSPYAFIESTLSAATTGVLNSYFTGTADSVVTVSTAAILNTIGASSTTSYDEMTVTGWLFYERSAFRDGNYSYARSAAFKNDIQASINLLDSTAVYTMTVTKLNEPTLSGTCTRMARPLLFAALSCALMLM
jgi:hypothetical protein